MAVETRLTSSTGLSTYLEDHLAASAAGVELAERIQQRNENAACATFLADLVREIREDRDTLERIMSELEITKHRVKETLAWFGERLSRLKTSRLVTRNGQLTRLLEFELLSVGIEGKRLLWLALTEYSKIEDRLHGFDFDHLVGRAESQRAGLEHWRVDAAIKAFGY